MTVPDELKQEQITTQQSNAGSTVDSSSTPNANGHSKQEKTTLVNGEPRANGEFVELHQSDFKRIKESSQKKGHDAATLFYREKAKSLGFETIDEMLEAAAKARELAARQEPEPEATDDSEEVEEENVEMANDNKAVQNKNGSNGKPVTKDIHQRISDKRIARLMADEEKATRKWKSEETRRRELERQLAAKEAEMSLRETAMVSGVKDVDYALRLLTRHLQGKTEEELEAFNEAEFFSGLRKERPYLFGEHVAPATTGNGGHQTPPAPTAEDVQNKVTEGDRFNARTAKGEDIQKRLRELGLNPQL